MALLWGQRALCGSACAFWHEPINPACARGALGYGKAPEETQRPGGRLISSYKLSRETLLSSCVCEKLRSSWNGQIASHFLNRKRGRRSPHKGVPDACECEWRPYFHMEGAQPTNEES